MDLSQEIKSFGPIDLDEFAQNYEKTDKVINSVALYNKAIEYLKSGNEDIAMIELKKVVSTNPNFYEAVNLLGLCYAYTNQLDKAEELFTSIVERENNAIKAADYLNFISISEDDSAKKYGRVKNARNEGNSIKAVKQPLKKNSINDKNIMAENTVLEKIGSKLMKPNFSVILNIFSVICLIASVIFFIAATKATKDAGAEAEPVAEPVAISQQKSTTTKNSSKELITLKNQLDAANKKLKQYEFSNQVSQVSTLYAQKKYIEAADRLMSLKVDDLTSDLKIKYDSMKDKVLLSAASQMTSEGNTLYKNKNFAEAIKKLEKVFTLGDKWDFADKALYILGKSYVEVNDLQKATITYEKLIKEYPKSAYIQWAKDRLNAIH